MAQVLIRGLDEKVLERLKAQAKKNNHSLEAELRQIIESSVQYTSEEAVLVSRWLREQLKGKKLTDSTELLREDRDR